MKKYNMLKGVRSSYIVALLLFGYLAITNETIEVSDIILYVVLVFNLIQALFETYSIEIHENNKIQFKKIVFSKIYEIKDIIKFTRGSLGCDYIIFKNGKESIPAFMEDPTGMRALLKEINLGLK